MGKFLAYTVIAVRHLVHALFSIGYSLGNSYNLCTRRSAIRLRPGGPRRRRVAIVIWHRRREYRKE